MEKVPWSRMGLSLGWFGGVRGGERGDAKTCFSAGQGRRSLFKGHSPGGATDVRILLVVENRSNTE